MGLWLDLVRVPPQGTWERPRADNYGLAEHWVGPPASSREEGVRLAVRRYLGGFGPAPARDIAAWAGLPVSEVTRAVAHMRLTRYRDEAGGELLDLPRLPIPDSGTPAPVRLLGTFDAVLLANCRRARILPEDYRKRIFGTNDPAFGGDRARRRERCRLLEPERRPGRPSPRSTASTLPRGARWLPKPIGWRCSSREENGNVSAIASLEQMRGSC